MTEPELKDLLKQMYNNESVATLEDQCRRGATKLQRIELAAKTFNKRLFELTPVLQPGELAGILALWFDTWLGAYEKFHPEFCDCTNQITVQE